MLINVNIAKFRIKQSVLPFHREFEKVSARAEVVLYGEIYDGNSANERAIDFSNFFPPNAGKEANQDGALLTSLPVAHSREEFSEIIQPLSSLFLSSLFLSFLFGELSCAGVPGSVPY